MKILLLSKKSKANDGNQTKFQPATMVKKLGAYLVNNLTDARKLREEPNRFELVFDMMHMLPEDLRKQMKEYQQITTNFDPDILYIDNLYISIVTYSNSIWAYMTVEGSEDTQLGIGAEKTIGTIKFLPKELANFTLCKDKIVKYMIKKVQKEFAKYDLSDLQNPDYKTRR